MARDPPSYCPVHGSVFAEPVLFDADDRCPECGLPVKNEPNSMFDVAGLGDFPQAGDDLADAASAVVDAVAEREERVFREAIADTDWSETPVIQIVKRTARTQPVSPPSREKRDHFTISGPEFEVHRYESTPPPARRHYRYPGGLVEVTTVTEPLLERLFEEYDEEHGTWILSERPEDVRDAARGSDHHG